MRYHRPLAAPAAAGIPGLIAYVPFARRFAADHEQGWLMWTVVAPIAILAANAASAATGDLRPVLLGKAVGAAWATSPYVKLRA